MRQDSSLTEKATPAFRRVDAPTAVKLQDASLANTKDFVYLTIAISNNTSMTDEIKRRIKQGSSAFGRLCKKAFTNKYLKTLTRITVFEAVCLSILLYSCETWTHNSKG